MKRVGLCFIAVAAVVVSGLPLASAYGADSSGRPAQAAVEVRADFNGDVYTDLAIAAPYEDAGGVDDSGTVYVTYGGPDGLTGVGAQTFSQNTAGLADTAEPSDHFGLALASADFDGDGWTDLAIGVPHENIGAAADAGVVHVMYGSVNGLTTADSALFQQGVGGVQGLVEPGNMFGGALAAGDFKTDGMADLAIGAPGDDAGGANSAGVLHVLLSSGGLTGTGSQLFQQGGNGLGDTPEIGDAFGQRLASGDVNGDGRDDLAVGVPSESVAAASDAGLVHVILASVNGLNAFGSMIFHQDTTGIADEPESSEYFGDAVAIGDFRSDGSADLAIGVPRETIAGAEHTGSVHVLYSANGSLTATGSRLFRQGADGLADVPGAYDSFGRNLTAADFDGDGRADLAIASPEEAIGEWLTAGIVQTMRGTNQGLTGTGSRLFQQGADGVADPTPGSDNFGHALAAGDFNGDGRADLAVGTPFEQLGGLVEAGVVQTLLGVADEGILTGEGSQLIQEGAGAPGSPQSFDALGWSLAAG